MEASKTRSSLAGAGERVRSIPTVGSTGQRMEMPDLMTALRGQSILTYVLRILEPNSWRRRYLRGIENYACVNVPSRLVSAVIDLHTGMIS